MEPVTITIWILLTLWNEPLPDGFRTNAATTAFVSQAKCEDAKREFIIKQANAKIQKGASEDDRKYSAGCNWVDITHTPVAKEPDTKPKL